MRPSQLSSLGSIPALCRNRPWHGACAPHLLSLSTLSFLASEGSARSRVCQCLKWSSCEAHSVASLKPSYERQPPQHWAWEHCTTSQSLPCQVMLRDLSSLSDCFDFAMSSCVAKFRACQLCSQLFAQGSKSFQHRPCCQGCAEDPQSQPFWPRQCQAQVCLPYGVGPTPQ